MPGDLAAVSSPWATKKPAFLLWWRRFFIRLRSWEYWPMYIFNIPVAFIWLVNAVRAGNIFFFALTNPGIRTGGFFGESKSVILDPIPDTYKPRTVLLGAGLTENEIERLFEESGLSFPVIAKPDIGERGWRVAKLGSMPELKEYIRAHTIDLILQEFVALPLELSILAYKMPDGSTAGVSSICEKHFLQITGDGVHTVGQLIWQHDRAVLQYEMLTERFAGRWNTIPGPGEVILLEGIGNHCRGTMFLNRNDRIDDAVTRQMLALLDTMPGVFYGRFDMRVASWSSLYEGKDIRVLEFNGTASEPAHVYQPGYPLLRAYRDIAWHWWLMRRIAGQNRQNGHTADTFKKMLSAFFIYFRYKRTN